MAKRQLSKPPYKRLPRGRGSLWGGRFQQSSAPEFSRLNNSFPFDYRLLPFDIEGSLAYTVALGRAGILTFTEVRLLQKALRALRSTYAASPNKIQKELTKYEDVHSFVEAKLTEEIGDVARKLHTARSRNDQVALDLRLYLLAQTAEVRRSLIALMEAVLANAEKYLRVILPGYTHLQRAQPILFSHYWLAYFEMLARDVTRLDEVAQRTRVFPLGSGALAGHSFGIDRDRLARDLGFAAVSANSLDAVSDRDFVLEFLSASSILMMHLSRLAEDVILYSTSEFGFLELSDKVTSGSSLMPQKKNPDAMELVRGKTGRVFGNLQRLLTTLKALPLSYNKDLQEDKEALFDTLDTLTRALPVMTLTMKTLRVHAAPMRQACESGFLNATECADYLVRKGLPFRTAHEVVGKLVLSAIRQHVPLERLSWAEFQSHSSHFGKDIYAALKLEHGINTKSVKGGTATVQVKKAIQHARHYLSNLS